MKSLIAIVVLLAACASGATGPQTAATLRLRVANQSAATIHIPMGFAETANPGVYAVAPGDSICTVVTAYGDSVQLNVWSPSARIGTAWLLPSQASAWRLVVGTDIAAVPSAGC
jgi:hypothetical protein